MASSAASPVRRIGLLTAGGDCPGLNAVIRAVTKSAIYEYDLEVVGILDGYQGLIENRMRLLREQDASNILTQGGTILGANNKIDPLRYPIKENGQVTFHDVTDRCIEHLREHEIDALVVIGGDGSMAATAPLVRKGINCIGLPKTIDNDLYGTEVTFGFASAVDVATDALDRVHTTAASHHRAMVVEVMGRNAGWIALFSGIAAGADIILIPEIPYQIDRVCEKVLDRSKHGKRFSIICAAEGAAPLGGEQVVDHYDPNAPEPVRFGGVGRVVAHQIEERTGVETRFTVLGHVQRGGSPVAADRVLATRFGYAAVRRLMNGTRNRMIVMQQSEVTDIDILETAGRQRLIPTDYSLIATARAIGTSFGD